MPSSGPGRADPQRVCDLSSPPIVGQRYLVPCVEVPRHGLPDLLLPTLGPWHTDPELSPQIGLHIHYDPRFYDLRYVLTRAGDLPPEQVLMVSAHLPAAATRGAEQGRPICPVWDTALGDPLVDVEMECLREMPHFPRGHESAPWLTLAEGMYAATRTRTAGVGDGPPLQPGGPRRGCEVCPHRGTALGSLPVRGTRERHLPAAGSDGSTPIGHQHLVEPCEPARECVHGLRFRLDGRLARD